MMMCESDTLCYVEHHATLGLLYDTLPKFLLASAYHNAADKHTTLVDESKWLLEIWDTCSRSLNLW